MRNKRNLLLDLKKDKEDLEPLFVIEEEKLPMHIKYITLQMPNSVKKDRSLPRKLCACGCLVTTIIILSVALVLLVELVFDKNQQKQPLFLTDQNGTLQHVRNITDYHASLVHKDSLNTLQLPLESTSCHSVCRRYSAFRFKSFCDHGKCRCHGKFYNSNTCLPVVNDCVIEKNRNKVRKRLRRISLTSYSCNPNTKRSRARVHVVAMYGSTQQKISTIRLTSNDTTEFTITLVVANFLQTDWKVDLPENVKLKNLFLMSNKYLRDSAISFRKHQIPVTKMYSRVGYGDDRYNGYTVDLLRNINSNIGQITSFQGARFRSEWIIKV